MYCNKCGSSIPEGVIFCPTCGTETASGRQDTDRAINGSLSGSAQSTPAYPMKWFKFLIYFNLFVTAALALYYAYSFFTGSQYNQYYNASEYVYATFKGLKTADILYGIVCVLLAGYAIYVRQRLAHFCANGPKLFVAMYAVNLSTSFVYWLAVYFIVKSAVAFSSESVPLLSLSMIVSLITSVAMILANIFYFKKRKALFTH